MSKKKKPFEIPRKAGGGKKAGRSGQSSSSGPNAAVPKKDRREKKKSGPVGFFADPGVRETIESIVVAVILALLFRAYEAEAFVIPTGSMAPTLQGRHVDLFCDECGHNFRVGASGENPDRKPLRQTVTGRIEVDPDVEWLTGTATCPICRHTHELDRKIQGWKTNEDSFYGDRIIVSKFAYDLKDPERWDVIVFKYPANPKQNYIKRLIGLPGETIKLEFGNVYTRNEQGDFDIVRKPPHKLKAMLLLVDDTFHIAETLQEVNWPSRWDEWSAPEETRSWEIDRAGRHPSFELAATPDEKWLRYQHIVPTTEDWVKHLAQNELPPRLADFRGQLIADFYAYNFFVPRRLSQPRSVEDWMDMNEEGRYLPAKAGVHWVGDLALECEVNVRSDEGILKLDLVEAGTHFTCSIDVTTGIATLEASDEKIAFVTDGEKVAAAPSGRTPIRGKGKYRIRYANCDDKLYLWVNEKVIQFDGPTEYQNLTDQFPLPRYSPEDPGDAQPLGIAAQGLDVRIDRLRVLRDIYYINSRTGGSYQVFEYQDHPTNIYNGISYANNVFNSNLQSMPIRRIFEDPTAWDSPEGIEFFSRLVHSNPSYFYELGPDQFMPLGDNSPSSQDARAWDHGHYFERKYLIGKALFIYWPHAWRQPIFFPNFKRMGFIR